MHYFRKVMGKPRKISGFQAPVAQDLKQIQEILFAVFYSSLELNFYTHKWKSC
jgi:hypothetical protein